MKLDSSGYHTSTYEPKALGRRVKRVVKALKHLNRKLKFDAIAFRGSSGASVAYPVSILTGMHLIYVRKEKQHHGCPIEGTKRNIKRYIILDDFIYEGSTVKSIINAITRMARADCWSVCAAPKCVGIVLYDDQNDDKVFMHGNKMFPLFKI